MKKIYQAPEIEIKKLLLERIMDDGDPYLIDISQDQSIPNVSEDW